MGKTTKTQQARGGRRAASGRSSRRLRRFARGIRARTALAIAGGAVLLLAAGMFAIGRAATALRTLERNQYAAMASETRARFERLVERDRNRLIEAAFADELYARLGGTDIPSRADSALRPAFFDRFAVQHGDQLVAIYDMAGGTRFRWTADSALERAVSVNGVFRVLDNREPAIGLLRAGDQLYWVAGAPILPRAWQDTSRPIRGYLLTARRFESAMIAPSAADRGGRFAMVAIDPPASPIPTRVDDGVSPGTMEVTFPVPDLFAEQNSLAMLTVSRAEFLAAERTFRLAAGLAALLALVLAGFAYRAARRLLVAPAEQLSQALAPVHQGEIPHHVVPVSTAAEWTTVTDAVNRLIAAGRGTQDRFERLANAGTEGLWERDLTSGEWLVNDAFWTMLGTTSQEFASPAHALRARLHPEDAGPVNDWLAASPPASPTLDREVRIRLPKGTRAARFTGRLVTTDGSGRLTGSLRDMDAVAAADERAATAEKRRSADGRATGRMFRALAKDDLSPATRGYLEALGAARAGAIESRPEPFELFDLLQQVSAGRNGALTMVPGVSERVSGDREAVRLVLEALFDAAPGSARVALVAEQPDRSKPDMLRLRVEHHESPVDRTRLAAVLDTGRDDGAPLMLAALAAHDLAAALGGRTGVESAEDLVACWVTLPLPGLAPPPPPPAPPPPAEAVWDGSADFEIEARASAPFKVLDRPSRPESTVELVADATVTLRLDDPDPPAGTGVASSPLSDRFAERIGYRDPVGLGVVRTVRDNGPARLAELERALAAHELRAATEATLDLNRMAAALEASELERTTRVLAEALEGQYGESTDRELAAIQTAWSRLTQALDAAMPSAPPPPPPASVPSPAPTDDPPVDPATLEQLGASLTDGAGLGGQLITMFLAEAPIRIDAIEKAAGSGDVAALAAAARELQGMCGLVGAGPLSRSCATVAGATGPAAWAAALAVRAEWKRLQQVLDGLMGARIDA